MKDEKSHVYAKLSTYEGNPFVVGHSSNTLGNTAETFSLETKSWKVEADYPFSKRFKVEFIGDLELFFQDWLTMQRYLLATVFSSMVVTMEKPKCAQ